MPECTQPQTAAVRVDELGSIVAALDVEEALVATVDSEISVGFSGEAQRARVVAGEQGTLKHIPGAGGASCLLCGVLTST